MTQKYGDELIDEIGQSPTLDKYLDREPPLDPKELMELVEVLRAQRAQFITAQEKKKEGKDDE